MKQYLLVTDATAAEVEEKTGLSGRNTPFGVFVEYRDPAEEMKKFWSDLAEINRAFNPPKPQGCPHCHGVIMHRADCSVMMT